MRSEPVCTASGIDFHIDDSVDAFKAVVGDDRDGRSSRQRGYNVSDQLIRAFEMAKASRVNGASSCSSESRSTKMKEHQLRLLVLQQPDRGQSASAVIHPF